MGILIAWWAAVLLSTAAASVYVGSLYVIPARVRVLARNDPTHIRWRIGAVSVISLPLAVVVVPFPLSDGGSTLSDYLGVRKDNLLVSVGVTLLHTVVLFCGPLVQAGLMRTVVPEELRDPSAIRTASERPLEALRDVVVAPITEEWVFRAIIMTLLLSGFGVSTSVVLMSPMLFGVGHLHHYFKMRSSGSSAKEAAIQCAAQFMYTTLFGMYAAFVFARTGNTFAAIAAHMFCNLQGVPDVSFMDPRHQLHTFKQGILACYVLGLAGFIVLFWTPLWNQANFSSAWAW